MQLVPTVLYYVLHCGLMTGKTTIIWLLLVLEKHYLHACMGDPPDLLNISVHDGRVLQMHVHQASRNIQQQSKGFVVTDQFPVRLCHLFVGQPCK